MKKTFLMLALFLTTIGVSIAEEVWVRTYIIRDTPHPRKYGKTWPTGYEIKSYGPVDRSQVKERKGRVDLPPKTRPPGG